MYPVPGEKLNWLMGGRGGGEDEPIRRKARHVMFEAGESLALAEQLDNAIKDLLNPLPPPPDDEEAGEGGSEREGDTGEATATADMVRGTLFIAQ